jgi:hypothetical protein
VAGGLDPNVTSRVLAVYRDAPGDLRDQTRLQPALTARIAQHRLAGDDVHPLLDPIVKVVRALRVAGLGLPHARADHTAADRHGQVVSRGLELASFPQRLRLALRDVAFREHAA